jgi:hypothetical protein
MQRTSALARPFYFYMAILAAAVVTYGFSRTIDAGLIHPSFVVPAILYVHVATFVGWLALLLLQTGLIQSGRGALHRRIGLASIGFGAGLVVVGVWVSIVMARLEAARGDAQAGSFLIVPFADMAVFGTLFALGVRYRRSPETHRRLMLMAAFSLTAAAFARFPQFIVPRGWYPAAVDVAIGLGVLRDLMVQKRVHRVYLIGLPLLIAAQVLTAAIHHAAWWAAASKVFL